MARVVQISTAIAMLHSKTWAHDWRLDSAAQSAQLCGLNSAKKTALKISFRPTASARTYLMDGVKGRQTSLRYLRPYFLSKESKTKK